MPRVEQYGGQRVQTQVVSGPRARTPDVSSGSNALSSALAGTAANLSQEVIKYQERVDTTAAEEALLQFEKSKNDSFFNPETGYFNTNGRNAYDGASGARKNLEALRTKYSQGLDSAGARRMFDRAAAAQIARSDVDIARHASSGLQAWEVATLDAQVENSMENATLYWNDPKRLSVQREIGRQSVIDSAQMQGITGAALAERLQTYDSAFSTGAVNAAIRTGSQRGEELYEASKARIEGPDRIKIEDAIAAKKQQEATQALAAESITRATGIVSRAKTRQEVIDEVNLIDDLDLRDKTMRQALQKYGQNKAAESETRANSFEQGERFVFDGGTPEEFQASNPDAWDALSPKQQKALQKGEPVSTDWVKFSGLMTLPKAQLAKVDPTDHLTYLAPQQRNSLISAVKSARNTSSGSGKTDAQVGRARTTQVASVAREIFGKTGDLKGDKLGQYNTFHDLLSSEVDYREEQKGGSLTDDEFTGVLNGLVRKTVQEGFIFDSEYDLTDIPREEIPALTNRLRRGGYEVSSANLLKLYLNDTK